MAIVKTTICTITKISGFFGLSQITKESQCDSRYIISKTKTIYSICLFLILLSLFPIHLFSFQSSDDIAIEILKLYWSVMNPFGVVLSVAASIYRQKPLKDTANALNKISESLKDLTGQEVFVGKKEMIIFGIYYILAECYKLNEFYNPWAMLADFIVDLYIFLTICQFFEFAMVIWLLLMALDKGLTGCLMAYNECGRKAEMFKIIARIDGREGNWFLTEKNKEELTKKVICIPTICLFFSMDSRGVQSISYGNFRLNFDSSQPAWIHPKEYFNILPGCPT